MTNDWKEHFERTKENFIFQVEMRQALKEATLNIRGMRVLDYGAGATPLPLTQFSSLQKDQKETVAFDPNLKDGQTNNQGSFIPIEWTNGLPEGLFDLVVCHFSLHHLAKEPAALVKSLLPYQPKVFCIADYDYSDATLKEFKTTFIGQQEQRELTALFGGNWQLCYEYHRHLDQKIFTEALEQNGFNIVKAKRGQGIARFKFFIIGITPTSDMASRL